MNLTILHNAFQNIYRNIIISIVNKKKIPVSENKTKQTSKN